MLRTSIAGAIAAATLSGAALAQTTTAPAPAALKLDEVIARHVAARGGLDKLKSVQTIRMTGKATMGPGIEAPVSMEMKRPNRMRMEMQFQGMTAVQAYDGSSGWMIMPFMGRKDPQPMSPDDLKDAEEMSDIDGQLVDWKAKGHSVELIGKEAVEGTDAYKLKLTLKNGDVRWVFLEAESFLEIRGEGKRKVRGSELDFESSYGDYKEVGGIQFPHSVEAGPKGQPQRQKITIDKIELNPAIDDARFKMPAAAPESPAPKK